MCGIAGIARSGDDDPERAAEALRRMAAALRHRGPDDQGEDALPDDRQPSLLLAACRLAILDPTPAGHQPMRDPATGHELVMNGEIYNHLEVREALGPAERWRSRSDTETVLRAYAAWGESCLARFRGMFALALWDAATRTVWCARDRLGIKPLYFYTDDQRTVIASEVRALLASGLVPRRIDSRGLAGFVRFGSVPEPLTLVAGVRSLPAGCWMRLRDGRLVEAQRYWRAAGSATSPVEGEARAEIERAVREHLLSDVPVACFLSGGLDSSLVTALAVRAGSGPVRTLHVTGGEPRLDESGFAAHVAAHCGTDHRAVALGEPEAAGLVARAVAAMDLPSADGVNTYLVSGAAARAGVKVVLSGLGGDELYGGYPSFRLLPLAHRTAGLVGLIPEALRRLVVQGASGQRAAEMTARRARLVERYQALRALWSRRELRAMGLDDEVGYGIDEPDRELPIATRVSLLELTGYLRSTLLRDADALSMAHSVELRVPFLDHRLVERCLGDNVAAGRPPKAALRRAADGLLPDGIASRPKQGFVLPLDRWMRTGLRGFVDDGLAHLGRSGALSRLDLPRLAARFDAGELPWARLWALTVLGHWLRAHLH
jgi:asparagine synthase (glutamine-hydrolysing)